LYQKAKVKLKAYSEVLCKIIYVLEQGITIFSYLALLRGRACGFAEEIRVADKGAR
jgi:hypothetical protein